MPTILDEQQVLHLVNSQQIFEAWLAAQRQVAQHRYGMRWVRSSDREYLVRLKDASGNGKSLGVRCEETQRIFEQFNAAKQRAEEKAKTLKAKMQTQARINKALRIGRAPSIVGKILRAIALRSENLYTVIGTHAQFGYEAMAGVRMKSELLASGDIDLLAGSGNVIKIMTQTLVPDGLIGLLRKVDSSFDLVAENSYRAANASGFMVDLLIAPRDLRDTSQVTAAAADLVAAEVEGLQWLQNAPKVSITAIAADGLPFSMKVPDPRVFCMHKAWISLNADREPAKKIRDAAQAQALYPVIEEFLPQYPFGEAFMASVPNPLKSAFATVCGGRAQNIDEFSPGL